MSAAQVPNDLLDAEIYFRVFKKKSPKTYRYSHENGQAKSQSLEGAILHLSAGTAGEKVKHEISQEFSD